MDKNTLLSAFKKISETMTDKMEYLTELDSKFGDGDLGISMRDGFAGVVNFLESSADTDLGKVLMGCSTAFNRVAPSTLGTIISFCLMGMAKSLKGKTEAEVSELAEALGKGIELIKQRAKSDVGEKTILDSIVPASKALLANSGKGKAAFADAYEAAKEGLESTRNMVGKHGRIAYYGDKTLGEIDGGAAAGALIFGALADFAK